MHSNITIKNVSWLHFSWATLYFSQVQAFCEQWPFISNNVNDGYTSKQADGRDIYDINENHQW